MKVVNLKRFKKSMGITVAGSVVSMLSASAFAFDVPTNVSLDNDDLCWQSAAPSTNIYEDGAYLATVHGANCFGPVYENSTYQLVAHDHGIDHVFSRRSDPFLVTDDGEDDGADEGGLEFAEALVYFELNNTDGDLGIHSKVDGDEWREITLEDPTGRALIEISNSGAVAIQGLTELFFESAEPTFDELAPADFFARFPEGMYEWSGVTTDGEAIEGESFLSHKIPAAPSVFVNGTALEGCDSYPAINASTDGSYTVSWNDVFTRHPVLGSTPGAMDVGVELYQFVLSREEQEVGGQAFSELKLTIDVASDITEFTLPEGFVSAGVEVSNEVLVKSDEGNQSATELCWTGI